MVATDLFRLENLERQIDSYWVEIHKKYSIPTACIVFVLVGVPLGIMARRGGFGIAATLSLGFFVLYWACLIGGEKLADRDIVHPQSGCGSRTSSSASSGSFLSQDRARNDPHQLGALPTLHPPAMALEASGRTASGRPVKLIDRYIIRQFLTTTLFSLVAVLVVFIVIDAMEKLDDFIDKQAGMGIILHYYVFFVPEIIKLIMPVAMLLASLFVTARLSTQGELTAFKASGISLYRLMVPYVVVAFIVSGMLVYFNGWIVPLANPRNSPSSGPTCTRMSLTPPVRTSTSRTPRHASSRSGTSTTRATSPAACRSRSSMRRTRRSWWSAWMR